MIKKSLPHFADRLSANGRNPKQVLIAIIRKLLPQIYGTPESHQPDNPEKRAFAGS